MCVTLTTKTLDRTVKLRLTVEHAHLTETLEYEVLWSLSVTFKQHPTSDVITIQFVCRPGIYHLSQIEVF